MSIKLEVKDVAELEAKIDGLSSICDKGKKEFKSIIESFGVKFTGESTLYGSIWRSNNSQDIMIVNSKSNQEPQNIWIAAVGQDDINYPMWSQFSTKYITNTFIKVAPSLKEYYEKLANGKI